MEPKIVHKPAFTVVGMKHRGHNENMAPLWDQFLPRSQQILHRSVPLTAYGVIGNYDPQTGDYDYVASFGVDAVENIPDGMASWSVPEQMYAVFPTTLATVARVNDEAYGVWLPQSAYQGADGPMFELYDENFKSDSDPFYLYVAIKPK